MSSFIDWNVFSSIRNPEVVNDRLLELLSDLRGYLTASCYMSYPELPNALVLATECKARVAFRMSEQSWIEVQS